MTITNAVSNIEMRTRTVAQENGKVSTYTYETDSDKHTRKVTGDFESDGKIDAVSLFYEDEEGKTVLGFYDTDADGKNDFSSIFTYKDDGTLSTRFDDKNGDGEYDEFYNFTQAQDGTLVTTQEGNKVPKEMNGILQAFAFMTQHPEWKIEKSEPQS